MRFRGRLVRAVLAIAVLGVAAACGGSAEDPVPVAPPKQDEPGVEARPTAAELGTWPDVPCGEHGVARLILQQIREAADAALAAGTLPPPLHAQITALVAKCEKNEPPSPLPTAEHCARIGNALTAAQVGDWQTCKNELEHGH